MGTLKGQRVLVVGRGSGIARAITDAARAQGAHLIVAGRQTDLLETAYHGDGVDVCFVDVTYEESIAALARAVGSVDHVVVTPSARARAPLAELAGESVLLALRTKVYGSLMLAKHFASRINDGGSLVLFSGATATQPAPNMTAIAATNGAVSSLARSLAVEISPVRVNAVAPGTVDSGAWDALGPAKDDFMSVRAQRNPVGRVGVPDDVADAALFLMGSTFVTGVTLPVDGGETLA